MDTPMYVMQQAIDLNEKNPCESPTASPNFRSFVKDDIREDEYTGNWDLQPDEESEDDELIIAPPVAQPKPTPAQERQTLKDNMISALG